MRLTVIGGAGYVGLITAVGFARLGHQVVACDVDEARVEALTQGHSPIHEPGIEEAIAVAFEEGTLTFSTDAASAVVGAELVFLAVGSPPRRDGSTDMSQVRSAVAAIAPALSPRATLVIKSTLPAGSVSLVEQLLADAGAPEGMPIAVNPEFLSEGSGLRDFFHPHRIIVGTDSPAAAARIRKLYSPFIDAVGSPGIAHGIPYIETTPINAQLVKYASNAYLAARVSFVNEIAAVCGQLGADVDEVLAGMAKDPRIGSHYLKPGIGFGGPRGFTPVLAHVERIGPLQKMPALLEGLVARGCYAQVTASSVLGALGRGAQRAAERFLNDGLVHVIASDPHRPTGPRGPMPVGIEQRLAELMGDGTARTLLHDNPLAILNDERPVEVRPTRRARRWWLPLRR